MPKGKNQEEERQLPNLEDEADATETGEPLFDDLNVRFTHKLNAAAAAEERESAEDAGEVDEYADEEDEDEDEPTPADADEEDVDPSDEDEDEPRPGRKPTKIEKRIQRAQRLADEAREEARVLAERLNQREHADKLAASTVEFNSFKADTEAKLDKLKKDKIAAKENGDSTLEVEIDDKISDLKGELFARSKEHEKAKAELEAATTQRGASQITLTKVAQWKRRNPLYAKDPAFAAAVHGTDQELSRSGSNPESDSHYEKLDRLLKKRFPQFYKPKRELRTHPSAQPRGAAPAQRRSTEQRGATVRNGKLSVPPGEMNRIKANMAKFGMDPSNPNDVKEYLQNNR